VPDVSDVVRGTRPWMAVSLESYVAEVPVIRRELVLEAADDLALPAFKGALWHAVLGPALKSLVCTVPPGVCAGCHRRTECAYPRVMEAESPVASGGPIGGGARVPGLLVLDAGPWQAQRLRSGERFTLGITAVGRDPALADVIAEALVRGAAGGLGRRRSRARLVATISRPGLQESVLASGVAPTATVRIRLLTPLRLKRGGAILRRLDLQALARDLCLRLAALGHYHGGLPWPAPWADAVEQAGSARVTSSTRWVEAMRYSARQQREIVTGGLMGEVHIEGAGRDLRRLLAVGSVLHAGKGASMGLGELGVEPTPAMPRAEGGVHE
jgi:hypothetical protein